METIPAKTIVTRNNNTAWFGCEYNMNLYRGCCHGCLYCDSRSDCYHVEDFDKVRAKADALRIVRDTLMRRVKTGVVATGAMSDPYNPFEKKEQLTRHAFELINAYGFGVAVATKSDLIVRDIDVFKDILEHSPVLCKITITTTSDDMAAKLEPYAPLSSRRFAALETLASNGIFAGILMMPLMPWLTDTKENVRGIVQRAADSGARFIYPSFGVTMRAGQREHLQNGLNLAFPGEEIGEKYRRRFGTRYHCSSPHAKQLYALFAEECSRFGLLYEMRDIVRAYRQGYASQQLSFI